MTIVGHRHSYRGASPWEGPINLSLWDSPMGLSLWDSTTLQLLLALQLAGADCH